MPLLGFLAVLLMALLYSSCNLTVPWLNGLNFSLGFANGIVQLVQSTYGLELGGSSHVGTAINMMLIINIGFATLLTFLIGHLMTAKMFMVREHTNPYTKPSTNRL